MAVLYFLYVGFQGSATDLVELHRFEQRAKVAFAEAFIAFPLDDLEEDGPDGRLREDLQEEPAARRAIEEDLAGAQLVERLAVAGKALVEQLVVGVGRIEQVNVARRKDIEIGRAHV